MEALKIKGTDILPNVILDTSNNTFEITGRSVPPNGKLFYEPVIEWMEKYAVNPKPSTIFVFNLEFFNISSSKMLLFILYKLNEIKQAGNNVNVIWNYAEADNDMFEVGEDYAFMVDIPFQFVIDTARVKNNTFPFS